MAEIERMTITLPSDMAAVVKGAVEGGDYADSDEVGHAFQLEAGHCFRTEAGRGSDLKPAT